MARHIKVRGELLLPDFRRVKVTILEQTHFGEHFGKDTGGYDRVGKFTYAKFSLESCPWYGLGGYYRTKFRVLASRNHLTSQDARVRTCTVDLEKWNKIKKTVEAYNKRYSEEP